MVVLAVAEHENSVIHCSFRPLFGQNGRKKVPCFPYFISRSSLGGSQRRVEVALWRLVGKDSSEICPAVSRVSQVGCEVLMFSKASDEKATS